MHKMPGEVSHTVPFGSLCVDTLSHVHYKQQNVMEYNV